MPMYDWKCTKCEGVTTVLRSFDDYQLQPISEDGLTIKYPEGSKEKKRCKHKWERIIGSGSVVRGPGWGSKGNLY